MINVSEHKELNPMTKRMVEECLILGKLADDDDPNIFNLGLDFGKSISIARMDGPQKIVFYLEPLSTEPEAFSHMLGKNKNELFVSFDINNKRYLQRTGYFDQEDKISFLREHFKNRRFLFKPVLNYDKNHNRYHYNFEIVLDEKIETGEGLRRDYVPVPLLSKSITHGRFERRLLEGKPIELPLFNHAFEIPEFIICDNYIYHITDESAFEKYPVNDNLYLCKKPEEVTRFEIENYEELLQMLHKEIAFISSEIRFDWIGEKDEHGIVITEIEKEKIVKKEKEPEPTKESGVEETNEVQKIDEYGFIHRLDFLARMKKLRYSQDDLYNLHTSLKTSNFTILGGMSGTGKTKLALLYAEALNLVEGDNLLFIPVQPSYTEPSDILGFFNPQTGVYTESEVGLVSFLYNASKHTDKMYMVLFDEMNLGQVEHYFSDFISLLELELGERRLRLFNKGANCVQTHLKDGILVGDNVLFIGTANFDETTKDFSNRMLDRSNVIILEKLSFLDAQKHELAKINNIEDYVNQEKNEMFDPKIEITAQNYRSWIQGDKSLITFNEYELSILDKLHEEISNFDAQTGVSFRIAKQIAYYLENIPQDEAGNEFLSRGTAFDFQIKQRILTKIRGHREQIGSLVGHFEEEYNGGRLSIILSEDGKMDFVNSIEFLKQKAKELTRNGYTL